MSELQTRRARVIEEVEQAFPVTLAPVEQVFRQHIKKVNGRLFKDQAGGVFVIFFAKTANKFHIGPEDLLRAAVSIQREVVVVTYDAEYTEHVTLREALLYLRLRGMIHV